MSNDYEARISRLQDKLDYAQREIAELRKELQGRARARPARVPAAVAAIGIEPWMQTPHDSERR